MNARVTSPCLSWLGLTLFALGVASSSACDPDPTYEPPGRGLVAPNPGAVANLPSAELPDVPLPRSAAGAGAAAGAAGEAAGVGAASGDTGEAPPRDLSAELAAALGQPADCLSGAASAPLVGVSVTTLVNEQGMVLRASASGPLTPEGIACMEARAQGVRLRAPVPRAPVAVTTIVVFRQTTPAVPATRTLVTEPQQPLPPGVVDPMGPGSVPIAPRAGVPIAPRAGVPIEARPGTPVAPTEGVSIMGPSGVAIGQ